MKFDDTTLDDLSSDQRLLLEYVLTFENDGKICFGLPKWEFPTEKKIKKMTLPPQKNLPVTPCSHVLIFPACLHAGIHFPSFGWG